MAWKTVEPVVGLMWWAMTWLIGGLMSAMFILAPLLLANIAVELRASLPTNVALSGGVIGAYAINLPPWDAQEPVGLPLVVGGAAVSVVGFDLIRGSADAVTLLIVLGMTVIGWPLRRSIGGRFRHR